MLRKAHERVTEHKLDHVEAIAVMDAQHLGFPDASFDVVVAQYVITAVPDPEATLDEFVRVTKPGGEIILVNHLGAEAGPRRLFEQGFAPLARRLGWRPEFRWERLAHWAERHGGVRLVERRAMPPLGHFSLIRFERVAPRPARRGALRDACPVTGSARPVGPAAAEPWRAHAATKPLINGTDRRVTPRRQAHVDERAPVSHISACVWRGSSDG